MAKEKNTELTTVSGNFGRAFNSCINSDWAITEEGYRTVLMIASRLNGETAVEAFKSDLLPNTNSVKIRDGVAIIPITGPIFRYANLFTYYSGGTSVSIIARDFQAALDNPKVYSIMFEINSPGGEVTGINELGKMIYAARKKMPMTTRVGGLMCSAALWLGVMAGDVVIDETAQIGSIGVCTAYLDDRKNLEMRGLEEIEFISSQSPFKNAPAYTDEGKQKIQARIDALCNIFGEAVALGRGVPIKTVWGKFGQGDVFVGQSAITVGLADRIGSYEETIRLLGKAHTPGYVDNAIGETDDDEPEYVEPFEEKKNDDEKLSKTINISNDLKSDADKVGESVPAKINTEEEKREEDIMSQEKDNKQESDNVAQTLAADNAEADFEAREKALIEREKALQQREEEAVKIQQKAEAKVRRTEFAKIAEGFAGKQVEKVNLMESLADTFGLDSTEFKNYVEDQKALSAQIENGGIFQEFGSSTATDSNTLAADERLDKMAKERAAKDGCTFEQAYTKILGENPKLFAETQSASGAE